MDKYDQIDTFNRLTRVSRETITSLRFYENKLIQANRGLNLIGNSTINYIWTRHFLDSFQVVDYIDKKDKNLVDLGSGAGFPGLIIAIGARDRKIPIKVKLIEKSPKKTKFLEEMIGELNLNAEVINQNIIEQKIKFSEDVFTARAFKPLQIILELMHNKMQNLKKFFIFLGKTGQSELLEASKRWDIKYKERMSITSTDSILIEINNIKKK